MSGRSARAHPPMIKLVSDYRLIAIFLWEYFSPLFVLLTFLLVASELLYERGDVLVGLVGPKIVMIATHRLAK